jgi:hypothetical protein
MIVREIKKEIEELKNFSQSLEDFKKNINQNESFKDPELIKHVNEINEHISIVMDNADVDKRLTIHARDLLNLELAKIRNDSSKISLLKNKLVNDEVLNINLTEQMIKDNSVHLELLNKKNQEINQLLEQKMTLEQKLQHYDQLHHSQIGSLISLNERHNQISKKIKRNLQRGA